MPKDTKSSGYNKAPACESRGFGHKKEGENFDTPSQTSLLLIINCVCLYKNPFLLGLLSSQLKNTLEREIDSLLLFYILITILF